MKSPEKVVNHITQWLANYLEDAKMEGFVVGISGGIDSALTSTLCAITAKPVLCIEMPIKQGDDQLSRSAQHIEWLKQKYPNKEIGYSGHEYRLQTTTAAVALGSTWVERHITLDRNMWGSDQKSSIEPAGLFHLMADIAAVEKAIQFPPQKRKQFKGENSKRESLRKKI